MFARGSDVFYQTLMFIKPDWVKYIKLKTAEQNYFKIYTASYHYQKYSKILQLRTVTIEINIIRM